MRKHIADSLWFKRKLKELVKSGEILKYTCVLDGSGKIGLLVLKTRSVKHRKIWTIYKVKVKEKYYYSFFWGSHYVYVGTLDDFEKVPEVLFIFLHFLFPSPLPR